MVILAVKKQVRIATGVHNISTENKCANTENCVAKT